MLRSHITRAGQASSQYEGTRLRLSTGNGRNGLVNVYQGYSATDISEEEISVEGVQIFNGGRNLIAIARKEPRVFVFEFGEPYNFLDSKLVSTLDANNLSSSNINDIWMSDDGTKMAYVGRGSDKAHCGTCSTPYDVTTYGNETVTPATLRNTAGTTVETGVRALEVHPSGTKFWVWGRSTDSVLQYNLSSAFDFSTAPTNANITKSTATQSNTLESIRWADSGTKLYVTGNFGYVYRYNTATYDISTFTNQTSTNTKILANGNSHQGAHFNNRLLENFDVTGTSTYLPRIATVLEDRIVVALVDSADGNHFAMELISLEMTTDWDEETLQVNPTAMEGIWRSGQTTGSDFSGFDFSLQQNNYDSVPAGGTLIIGRLDGDIQKYLLNTPFGLIGFGGTASQTYSTGITGGVKDIFVRPNGQDIYVLTSTEVKRYRLSTSWDLASTITNDQNWLHGVSSVGSMWVDPFGGSFWVSGFVGGPAVKKRTTTSNFSLNTTVADVSYSLTNVVTGTRVLSQAWKDDGTKVILLSAESGDKCIPHLEEFNLSTAWDLSNTSRDAGTRVTGIPVCLNGTQHSRMRWQYGNVNANATFGGKGRRMFVSGSQENNCIFTLATF